jgi:hypothetical protein
MKTLRQLALGLLSIALLSSVTHAQENRYQLQFRGTAVSTNEFGDYSKQTINQNTLIAECVSDLALTNKPKLMLVYHENADFNGDVIEVIGSKTGQVFCQKLRLLFPASMSNPSGSEVTQFVYVFPVNGNDAIGQGVITKKTNKGKTRINGQLIYLLPPDGNNPVKIINATLNSSKQVNIAD